MAIRDRDGRCLTMGPTSRRSFLGAAAAVAAGLTGASAGAAPVRRRGIPLGYDNFAVRAMQWNARQLIDQIDVEIHGERQAER